MGVSKIWRSEIRSYCDEYDLDEKQRDRMYLYIRVMDDHYVTHMNKKSK